MKQKSALIFLTIVLAILLPLLLQVAWPFFTPFILASILAIMLHPVKEWLRVRTRRPGMSSFLTTFAAVLLLGVLVAFVGLSLTQELTNVYNGLSRRSPQEGGWPSLAARTTDRVADAVATRLPIDKDAIRTELLDRMKGASAYLLSNVGVAVGGVTNAVVNGLLGTIFLYFLLRYGSDWVARLAALTPLDSRTNDRLLRTVRDSILANLSGMLAVIVAQGLFLSLGFWFIGVRSPALWGMLGGLASIVPVVGAFLIWAPVAIAYVLMGAYGQALFLVLWSSLVVGSVDNFLRPWIVGKRNELHPMLIALAAIGGTYAFGALGILLGPLLVSLVAVLIQEIQPLIPHRKFANGVAEPQSDASNGG
jgi:predicted PurR-regulated permease PerM